jgi:dTDP-4-amino-4,6-dideoxygalactose transaminase
MKKRSIPTWPQFSSGAIEAVANVLRSGRVNYWTGDEGKQFEKEYAVATATKYAIALANGTVSIELALRALEIGDGDEVIVPPRSFVATASAVAMVGAEPVFADVDEISGNITAASIEEVMTARTRAVLVVHLGGWPCEMSEIVGLARRNGLKIIEDCAQAHGATYKGRPVGSIGDVGSFSFCQDKIISTGGEGGMITTNDREIWNRIWSLKDHGKSFAKVFEKNHEFGFRWVHESFGTNARMTEMQAAIGRISLQHLEETIASRQRRAAILAEGFRKVPCLRVPEVPEDLLHSCYRYYFYVRPENLKSGWSRDRLIREINDRGAPCMSGSCSEIYLEKAFVDCDWGPRERLCVAKRLGETSITFPIYQTISEDDIQYILSCACEVLSEASKT